MFRIVSRTVFFIVSIGDHYAANASGGRGTFGGAARFVDIESARRCAARVRLLNSKIRTPPEVSVLRITIDEVV